jgi:CheY-like chemotaxis protein
MPCTHPHTHTHTPHPTPTLHTQMPIMDGIESTERYRLFENEEETARSAKDGTPKKELLIIGMSANSDAESKAEALRAGMTHFITKPFQYSEFAKIVIRHEMTTSSKERDCPV